MTNEPDSTAPEPDPAESKPREAAEKTGAGRPFGRRRIQIGSRKPIQRPGGVAKSDSATTGKSVPVEPPVAEPQAAGSAPPETAPPVPVSAESAPPAAEAVPASAEAVPAPPVKRRAPVPVPSRRDRISADLEAEIDAALDGVSLDELLTGRSNRDVGQPLELESRHRAAVVGTHGDSVFFSLDGRNEGAAPLRQFAEPPQPGTMVDVIVTGFHAEDGLYELSVPGASVSVGDWGDLAEGVLVEARVTGSNAGGLECMVNQIRGFIPASQVAMYRVENFAEFVDQKLLCVVTECNPERRNLVLSRRGVLEREKEEARQSLLRELEVGQVREGVVRSVRDFGAFVDLGGVDGLVHVSQLSWERVNHPSEVLQEGQRIRVRVEKVDPQSGKISLSYRDLLENPWNTVEQRFPAGSIMPGTISRIAKFGAFVKLAPGIEGLIHISELAHHRVVKVENVVQEGQEVEVKIISVDAEKQRIALSLKAALAAPEQEPEEPESEPEELPRKPVVAKHKSPLKGGTDRATGGEQFGLKW